MALRSVINRAIRLNRNEYLTIDEEERFAKAIFAMHLGRYSPGMVYRLLNEGGSGDDPFHRLYHGLSIENTIFTRELLNATLEIYHTAREWLPIFYAAALSRGDEMEMLDVIEEHLISMPSDLAAFILKVLSQIEAEMREQIAANFVRVPYKYHDFIRTKRHFTSIYNPTLDQLATLKKRLAAHNLSF